MNWKRKVTNNCLGKFQKVGKTREEWELGALVLNLTLVLTLHSDYPFLLRVSVFSTTEGKALSEMLPDALKFYLVVNRSIGFYKTSSSEMTIGKPGAL